MDLERDEALDGEREHDVLELAAALDLDHRGEGPLAGEGVRGENAPVGAVNS